MALPLRRALVAVLLLRLTLGEASANPGLNGAGRLDPTGVVHLSWHPRAFLHKRFLSDAECDHIIALAKADGLEKSMVVDRESGKNVENEARTSSGVFLARNQDEVLARVEDRIAAWTFLPPENGEQIQVLQYKNGEKYEPHFDHFSDGRNKAIGGHRIATVLMYLSNVKMGGETVFPSSEDRLTQEKDDTWSECAKLGYAVKPVKGDALLFFSLHPNATTDRNSLHGSCPVIEGEKWSATKWIHVRPFGEQKTDECQDEDDRCPGWAATGECAKNPEYMVGTRDSPGSCRRSCNVCAV